MLDPEEEAYSSIFSALKHPIRRKILRMLRERPRSFSEMLEAFKIESPHLTYHLEALGDLLYKTKDGKYGLSTFGEAATSMMYQIEEAPRTPLHLPSLPQKWKAVFTVLMMGLILLGSLSYVQYQTLNQLSAEYERSKAEVERLQQLFNLETTILTNEYIVNGSVQEVMFTNKTVFTAEQYVIYNTLENSMLEMKISFFVPLPPNVSMLLSVGTKFEEGNIMPPNSFRSLALWLLRSGINATLSMPSRISISIPNGINAHARALINMNNDVVFYASLPSTGWYILHFVPSFYVQGNYTAQYTVSFRIKKQGMYVPFFVRVKDTKTFQIYVLFL